MLEVVETILAESPTSDLVRLVVVPAFGWLAYRDIRTRRIPNRTWLPLAALGVALLLWDASRVLGGDFVLGSGGPELFFMRVALSLGLVAPIGYLFYWFGGFGGADAKALIVLAVLFPTFPTYILPHGDLPLLRTTVGVFSLTILSNTVLVGAAYPVAMALANAVRGHVSKVMVIAKPVPADSLDGRYGSLMETPEGYTRRGLDLDALRMYLRWRGLTLEELRAEPDRYHDPDSVPENPNPLGDGSLGGGDGSVDHDEGVERDEPLTPDPGDDWGAEAFLADIEGTAYGTSPEGLRDGLEVVTSEETVWMTPGTPFLVPMFGGLLVSLVYGDLLVRLIALVVG
ncbi:MAG: prepilin peptidase [Haloarculaceae archaeon]